jgi:hypothetical protein
MASDPDTSISWIKASKAYAAIANSIHTFKWIWAGVGVAIIIVVAFATFGFEKTIAPGVSETRAKLIEAKIKKDLVDPESLQIEWWPYHNKRNYCGLFNAKNRMGGYVGKKLFAAFVFWNLNSDDVVTLMTSQSEDPLSDDENEIATKFNMFIREECVRGGYKQELMDAGLSN